MPEEKNGEFLLPLPEGHEQRPFVLAWVEKAAADKLQSPTMVFSEETAGLKMETVLERFETTGGPQNEGADTTFG